MNKKLLAAAIAAAVVAAPAAFADSTVYGKFHTSVDTIDNDKNVDNWQMNSRASRLGFKGSEDLGNGLKAIYQVELSVQTDGNDSDANRGQDGGDGWGGQRNTFIGLSSDWGTLLVGRHDTPMKVAFYAAGNDRLGDSAIDINTSNSLKPSKSDSSPIGVFSEYRADNAIAYISPNFGGFTFVGAVIPGEDWAGDNNSGDGDDSTTPPTPPTVVGDDRDGIADHYSLGAMWSGAGFKVSGGYQQTTALDVDQDTWQLGASYTMNAFSIGAQYEDTSDYAFSKDTDYTAWAVTGKFTFGNNAISAVYTNSEKDAVDNAKDVDTDGWGIAAEHNFSKRTQAYVAYAADSRDYDAGDQDVSVFSVGMVHNF